MIDKTALYRVSNQIRTKWVKGKHVIELYPTFGFLSLRLMKKAPLSYTLVESDKRVVSALKSVGQAAQENGIGVRIIRSEPLDHRFDQLHFNKQRRGLHYVADWNAMPDTIVVSNTPFWATQVDLLS